MEPAFDFSTMFDLKTQHHFANPQFTGRVGLPVPPEIATPLANRAREDATRLEAGRPTLLHMKQLEPAAFAAAVPATPSAAARIIVLPPAIVTAAQFHAYMAYVTTLEPWLHDSALLSVTNSSAVSSPPVFAMATPTSSSYRFFDNACTYHVTNDASLVYDLHPLLHPLPLNGVGGGIALTHSCRFRCFPPTGPLGVGYFSASCAGTLLSLGYLVRHGGSYRSTSNPPGIEVFLPGGTLFARATLDNANMLALSLGVMSRPYSAPSAYACPAVPSSDPPVLPPAPVPGAHVTPEQRIRCDEVQSLLFDHGFPTDDRLIMDIKLGVINTHLSPADVRLNRSLRGVCPHTVAGSYRSPPHATVSHPP